MQCVWRPQLNAHARQQACQQAAATCMDGAACSAQVLSINKALPLQAHPTTSSAGPMHEAHPDVSDGT